MATSLRSRFWLFTDNNPAQDDITPILASSPNVRYATWQVERGDNGTRHLQGYLEWKTTQRLAACKKLLDRAHWEIRRGSQKEAIQYCTKVYQYPIYKLTQIRKIPELENLSLMESQQEDRVSETTSKPSKNQSTQTFLSGISGNLTFRLCSDTTEPCESIEIKPCEIEIGRQNSLYSWDLQGAESQDFVESSFPMLTGSHQEKSGLTDTKDKMPSCSMTSMDGSPSTCFFDLPTDTRCLLRQKEDPVSLWQEPWSSPPTSPWRNGIEKKSEYDMTSELWNDEWMNYILGSPTEQKK